MSNRTLVELNHDFCPDAGDVGWLIAIISYMRAGDKNELPPGVTFKHMRHHSDPDPMAGHGDAS